MENYSFTTDEFLALCAQGLTLTQIAVRFGILKEQLFTLGANSSAWNVAFKKGKELCQAYHEDLFNSMMADGSTADTKDRDLQRWRLETLFKEDWSDKSPAGDTKDKYSQLSTDQLEQRIRNLVDKPEIRALLLGKSST